MAFENVDYKSLDIPAAPFSDPSIIPDFPKNKVPRHVGVIMDGNGRWAQQRGLIRTDGHQAAEPVVFDTIAGAIEAGVRYLSLYTFSTENWKRSPQEVRFLMGFSRDIIHRRVDQMNEWGVRVRWSGRRPKLWKSVIDELEVLGKPFVILLNSTRPDAPETRAMAAEMEESYGRTVLPVSCLDLDEAQLGEILQKVLYEFPVRELDFALPRWVTMLDKGHWLQTEVYTAAMQLSEKISRMKDVSDSGRAALDCEAVENAALSGMNLADGVVRITVLLKPEVFYKVLSEQTGLEIGDEAGLMPCIIELAKAKRAYEKIRSAMEQVEATGYGIVMPSIDELSLEQPEIVRQGGRYGVRLEASAPSIHMMKAVIHTELSPIVGTEKQSEDLVQSLLKDFEDDPVRLWESNIFGKSLHELVNDGLQNKLLHMPQEARGRLQETLERVINEGCTGLICILI